MITATQLRARKKELPGVPVVCYVNSSADVKAESDICCTSANAVKVVNSLSAREVLFVPDQYLGRWVSTQTDKKVYLWPGYCPTHAKIMPQDILNLKQRYPQAKVIVHPECRPDVIALADAVLSTGGMGRYVSQSDAKTFIVGTEVGIIHRLKKENPTKIFLPISNKTTCPNMKLITLEKILWSLEEMTTVIKVPADICVKAKLALDRMLVLS